MSDSVYKIVELIGTSTESWERAAASAVERAAETLRDLRIAEVVQLDIQIKDGKTIWRQALPAPVVKDGLAVDSQARIVAALENGQVVCLQ